MIYTVTISSTNGEKHTYTCGGASDQALAYAGKVEEAHGDRNDPRASISIANNGENIGPAATLAEMTRRAV